MYIFKNILCVTAFVILLLPLCGCGEKTGGEDAHAVGSAVSSETVYPVGSYERRAAEFAAEGKDISGREVTDFGEGSIFGGIQVECDENGEIVCTSKDGALWYRITDKRFGSYSDLAGFVRKKAGAGETDVLRRYFLQGEEALYFAVGAKEHNVKAACRYYSDDASRLNVIVTHQSSPKQRNRTVRSDIHFVRENGVWKLDRLTVSRL